MFGPHYDKGLDRWWLIKMSRNFMVNYLVGLIQRFLRVEVGWAKLKDLVFHVLKSALPKKAAQM